MIANLFNAQTAAAVLAGLATFFAIIAWLIPSEPDRKFRLRLNAMSRERGKLREQRLDELTMRAKPQIRRSKAGFFARLVQQSMPETGAAHDDLIANLRMAGLRSPGAEAMFIFFRMATPLVLGFAVFAAVLHYHPQNIGQRTSIMLTAAAVGFGYILPRLVLDRIIARRQQRIMRAFPDALDLLLICVQSGLSVEAALGRVTKDISGQCIELAEELSLTMAELSYLPIRWRAYANLGERIGLSSVKLITAALVQAERHGTSISQALNSAAHAGREARIAEAEYRAAALPPKLSVPLVVFFLPVLLTIILGPALIEAGRALTKHSQDFIEQTRKPGTTHPPPAPANRK
jgi:tight adherence protein C